MTIRFVKMHGAANDFVVIDHRAPFLPEDEAARMALVRRLCDRRRGVGADGVLLLDRDQDHDFAMRYFNADGGAADFCGNGARCLARFALDLGLGRAGEVRFATPVGAMRARRGADGAIEVAVGEVDGAGAVETVAAAGREFAGRASRPGVPHFVVPVDRLEQAPVAEWGAALRRHPRFAPEGANVDFVTRLGAGRVAIRTYERGVEGETLACGSGAIAAALWAVAEGERPPIAVRTAGGDELQVGLTPHRAGWEASLGGPTAIAYRGEWTEPAGVASAATGAPA
ncbi:MAG: diaminopimelate epimerase [Candidatus Eisenbacteria bacterium]|uniref:Diaminopimelate epimerase n=1 Tax=Eiseniibacteriota bacterium TaxID=2212470 RepID=A0A9D6L6T9_UNCEI|nr:diaminopimelate epimerase [Candidatus Eisenbacteria bacterium]MBI3539686.1 diaminopimelate epimerase [Candidatus Eisenbacteria bacterium]